MSLHDDFRHMGSCLADAIAGAAESFDIAPLCESPIEVIYGANLARILREGALVAGGKFVTCRQADQPQYEQRHLLLIPQYSWKRWRFDFAIKWSHLSLPRVFVECDGKAFHSSAEQIAADRRKDAEARRIGVTLLRFSGSQIHRNPIACATHTVKFI